MKKVINNHKLLLLLTVAIISCTFENQTLVTIADEKYMVADFRETYQFQTTEDSLQRVKKVDEFVNQMLFVKEARSRGYDQDPVVITAYETHKKDIISRGYYEASVVNKVKISDSELRKTYAKMIDQYHIAQIVFDSESLALYIEGELKKGAVFESFLHFSLDTITENGDIGVFSAMSLPPEILEQFEKMSVGRTTNAIKFGEFYYILKMLDHSKADSPAFNEVRDELETNLKREKIREESEKFIEKLVKEARIEYNDRGLEALLKPDSLITEEDLNMWIVKKHDTSYVHVRSVRDAVMYQYRQSFIDPKMLIERVLIPDLMYEKAMMVHFDKNIKIKRQLENTMGLLTYQKFYNDEVLEKVTVDSMEIVEYYNTHPDEFEGKEYNDVYFPVKIQLRDAKIGRTRKEYYERLRDKYEVVLNQSVLDKLLKEAK
ncbi:MAG: peptidyl-prolyl cis-trans isomerase [bacterium]